MFLRPSSASSDSEDEGAFNPNCNVSRLKVALHGDAAAKAELKQDISRNGPESYPKSFKSSQHYVASVMAGLVLGPQFGCCCVGLGVYGVEVAEHFMGEVSLIGALLRWVLGVLQWYPWTWLLFVCAHTASVISWVMVYGATREYWHIPFLQSRLQIRTLAKVYQNHVVFGCLGVSLLALWLALDYDDNATILVLSCLFGALHTWPTAKRLSLTTQTVDSQEELDLLRDSQLEWNCALKAGALEYAQMSGDGAGLPASVLVEGSSERAASIFDAMDSTGDGTISQKEIEAYTQANPGSAFSLLFVGTHHERQQKLSNFMQEINEIGGISSEIDRIRNHKDGTCVCKEGFITAYVRQFEFE